MDVASQLLYRRDRIRTFVSVAVVAMLVVGLVLLAYALFSGVATTDHSPARELMAPFRWWLEQADAA
jgi:uncharacterized membrane protein YqhA